MLPFQLSAGPSAGEGREQYRGARWEMESSLPETSYPRLGSLPLASGAFLPVPQEGLLCLLF